MRVYPQDEIQSHHQELQQSVFELWELSHPGKSLWLFPMALWPSVATVPETMGQRNTPWEWFLSQGSRPLLKKHCLDTGKDDHIDGPLLQEWLYGKAPSFVCEAQLAQARRKESNRQWLNQFAESAAAQERESERRRHLHKNFAHMSNTLDQIPVDKTWSPTESSRKMKPEVQ